MDPQLNCIDYSADATEFVVVGSEPIVLILLNINRLEFMMKKQNKLN
jgi:hypothetical protein